MLKTELLPDKVIKYLDDDFETLNLEKYYRIDDPYDKPNDVVLMIPEETSVPFDVEITGGKDGFTFSRLTDKKDIRLTNLHVGTEYTIKYSDKNGVYEEKFYTSERLPRMIKAEGLYNVRDIGGYVAENGKRIVFDKLYRGSEMNLCFDHGVQITEKGVKTLVEDLGVRTDIDLRNEEECCGIIKSPLGEKINYFRLPVLGYMSIFEERFNKTLYDIFTLLSERKNYPAYLHCWAGADRTGTVITILKAFLGVSYEDICRDHEISTFSIFGLRGRSNKEFTYVEVFEHLRKTYPAETLQKSAERYLMEKVGLTEKTLDEIKNILLEK